MPAEDKFKDRVVVVTGGASGIGRAVVESVHRQGGTVAVLDFSGQEAALVESLGPRALALSVDVSDLNAVADAVQRVRSEFGRIDGLCCSAGMVPEQADIVSIDVAQFQKAFEVNVLGTMNLMREVIPVMASQGGGAVVNISSTAGVRAIAKDNAYGTTKAAMIQMSRISAVDFADQGVRINVICPGAINTPGRDAVLAYRPKARNPEHTIPLGRVGDAEEVADVVSFLLSPESSFMTGVVLPVDGGRHLT